MSEQTNHPDAVRTFATLNTNQEDAGNYPQRFQALLA